MDKYRSLYYSTELGATEFFNVLTEIECLRPFMLEHTEELLINSLQAENVEIFRELLNQSSNVSNNLLEEAEKQKNALISSLLSVSTVKLTEEAKKEKMKKDVETGEANIFKQIPRDVEFDYYSEKKLEMILPFLNGGPVAYEDLLKKVLCPQAHVGRRQKSNSKENWQKCPGDCREKENCSHLREVYYIAELIKEKLGNHEFMGYGFIFKDLGMQLIGSLKEGTKIFCTDELDIHLSLNSLKSKDVKFLPEKQIIKVNGEEFPSKDYAVFFFQCIKKTLDTIKIPKEFSMIPPTTSYSPCLYCTDTTDEEPQPKRCHHKSDCLIHSKKNCKDFENFPFECQCKNFANPSIGWSKIGAVLHFGKEQ